jgi:hypothetical protein
MVDVGSKCRSGGRGSSDDGNEDQARFSAESLRQGEIWEVS